MSQNDAGPCTNCSSCGGCSSGGSYSGLENIAASEISYQGSESDQVYQSSSGGNFVSYGTSGGSGSVYGVSNSGSFGYTVGQTLNSGYGGFSSSGGSLNYNSVDFSNQNYKNSLRNNEIINQVLSSRINQNYNFVPDNFLKPNRISQKFIGQAEEIKSEIEETFLTLTGLEFPEDIRLKICDRKEFDKFTKNPGVKGLSINRKEQGLISEIMVLNDELDKVMLTVGHELGHVLSRPLKDKRDEEAKAFAFSFAWMKTIKENNIAGLGKNIVFDNPACNGIHDVAFNYVWKLIKEGKESLELYWDLVRKVVSVPICS
tara:strand:- start:1624 stop:2571 length:948 start_codon:yes stop_codon:yes gene_type:complete